MLLWRCYRGSNIQIAGTETQREREGWRDGGREGERVSGRPAGSQERFPGTAAQVRSGTVFLLYGLGSFVIRNHRAVPKDNGTIENDWLNVSTLK